MTLARKIYKLMEVGKEYRIKDLADLLYKAEAEEDWYGREEALDEEWLDAVYSGNLRQRIREALKVTRKFGYTAVTVTVTPAHDWTGTIHGKHGSFQRTYHYGEFKDFTYRRIK